MYFRIFFLLFGSFSMLGTVLAFSNNIRPSLVFDFYFKGHFLTLFLLAFFYGMTKKITLIFETKLLLGFSIIPFFVGAFRYGLSKEVFSHLFMLVISVFGTSFGFNIAKDLYDPKNQRFIDSVFRFCFFFDIISLVLFNIAIYNNYVIYPAIFPVGLVYSSIYFLSKGRLIYFLGGAVSVFLLSGKRAPMIIFLVVLIVHALCMFSGNNVTKKTKFRLAGIMTLFLALIAPVTLYLWTFTSALNRVKDVLSFSFSDVDSFSKATAGRSDEIIKIFSALNKNPQDFVLGAGYGFKVEVLEDYYRHYSHFSPLTFLMIYGAPIAVILYFTTLSKLISKQNVLANSYFFYLFFLGYFIHSLSGATVVADIHYWVFFGMFLFEHSRDSSKVNTIRKANFNRYFLSVFRTYNEKRLSS